MTILVDKNVNNFVLIDGSSYLYRAYYALPHFTNSKGHNTGAIGGVVNMLIKLLKTHNPKYLCVIFDARGKNFRHKLVEFKPHKAVMPTNSLPHNVPSDGRGRGYLSWNTMMPDELVAAPSRPPTSPMTLPPPGRPLVSPITAPPQQPQQFAAIGFEKKEEDPETQFHMDIDMGGGRKPIRINSKMKGVFTRKAKKHKMSVQKYARYIIKKYKGKTKNKNQLKLLKQAVFAKTAKKWKKRKRKFSRKKRRK